MNSNKRQILQEIRELQDEVDSIRVELMKSNNRLVKVNKGLDKLVEVMQEEMGLSASTPK